ncbi:MAG: electron transfer flavoprotein subunit alpha/FixB family protein [Myxococcales bacterium]|nr:MAG: electron transfer flavoprotein subunit alpha/FixB family protein [Myxococcales bacterium]
MSILILAEHKKGKLVKASLGAVKAGAFVAQKTNLPYNILLIGPGAKDAAQTVANVGAAKVFVADDPKTANYLDELWADIVLQVAGQTGASWVIGLSTTQGKAVLPRVAARLEAGMASDVIALTDNLNFVRPMYAGNLNAEVEIASPKKVFSIRGTAFEPIAAGAAATIENVAVSADPAGYRKTFVKMEETVSTRPPLTEAPVVVSGGRGLKEAANFKLVEELADLMGGAVGATRAVVDAGWIHNDYQVGQTGKVVAPNLYVAVGISGAIQHLAGMKDSKTIVAINKDEEAPIFSVADYGLVADLFAVVPELTQKIKAVKTK